MDPFPGKIDPVHALLQGELPFLFDQCGRWVIQADNRCVAFGQGHQCGSRQSSGRTNQNNDSDDTSDHYTVHGSFSLCGFSCGFNFNQTAVAGKRATGRHFICGKYIDISPGIRPVVVRVIPGTGIQADHSRHDSIGHFGS